MVVGPHRGHLQQEASEMKPTRLFLCEGYDPLFGPIRDLIHAAGFGDAKTQFFKKHRLQATHITPTKI